MFLNKERSCKLKTEMISSLVTKTSAYMTVICFSVFVDWYGNALFSFTPDAMSQNAELFKSLEVYLQVCWEDQWWIRQVYGITGNAQMHSYSVDNIAKSSIWWVNGSFQIEAQEMLCDSRYCQSQNLLFISELWWECDINCSCPVAVSLLILTSNSSMTYFFIS